MTLLDEFRSRKQAGPLERLNDEFVITGQEASIGLLFINKNLVYTKRDLNKLSALIERSSKNFVRMKVLLQQEPFTNPPSLEESEFESISDNLQIALTALKAVVARKPKENETIDVFIDPTADMYHLTRRGSAPFPSVQKLPTTPATPPSQTTITSDPILSSFSSQTRLSRSDSSSSCEPTQSEPSTTADLRSVDMTIDPVDLLSSTRQFPPKTRRRRVVTIEEDFKTDHTMQSGQIVGDFLHPQPISVISDLNSKMDAIVIFDTSIEEELQTSLAPSSFSTSVDVEKVTQNENEEERKRETEESEHRRALRIKEKEARRLAREKRREEEEQLWMALEDTAAREMRVEWEKERRAELEEQRWKQMMPQQSIPLSPLSSSALLGEEDPGDSATVPSLSSPPHSPLQFPLSPLIRHPSTNPKMANKPIVKEGGDLSSLGSEDWEDITLFDALSTADNTQASEGSVNQEKIRKQRKSVSSVNSLTASPEITKSTPFNTSGGSTITSTLIQGPDEKDTPLGLSLALHQAITNTLQTRKSMLGQTGSVRAAPTDDSDESEDG
ncbi:hypothetical protein BLNAU_2870 [Blattamonas nauphoetae]|uniref:Uncharacterized protein n=1 Tax=Blattamonas nauphoetae TaxID=2049346 RepID=A0ABQ9YEX2_9EUKA|nr:hypothetical protein BLNAU_2870 [Blattamonas nauphoetae]